MSVDSSILLVPLRDIVPYGRNPRLNAKSISRVKDSLDIHGQVKPLVLSTPGHPFDVSILCCGHTLLEALALKGDTHARVMYHDFKDEAEFVDYNIRDNKTYEFGEWDEELLTELSESFDLDLFAMGFAEKGENDPLQEWQDSGMPDYENEDKGSGSNIKIHFVTDKDKEDFGTLIGVNLKDRKASIWWPPKERENLKSFRWETANES